MLKHIHFDSVLFLDIDNTTIESLLPLGSDQWFKYIFLYAHEVVSDSKIASQVALAIYTEIENNVKAKAVEMSIIAIIKLLQDIGMPVFALTARGDKQIEGTKRQLYDVGIDFNRHQKLIGHRVAFKIDDVDLAFYDNGIIYCCGNNKGMCVTAFLNKFNLKPKDMIVVDDSLKNVSSVRDALKPLAIKFTGMRYAHLDEKVSRFNHVEADNQLISVKECLSELTQSCVDTLKIKASGDGPLPDIHRFFYFDQAIYPIMRSAPQMPNFK